MPAFGVVLALTLLSLASSERKQKMIQQNLPAARQTRARADAQQIARAVQTSASGDGFTVTAP